MLLFLKKNFALFYCFVFTQDTCLKTDTSSVACTAQTANPMGNSYVLPSSVSQSRVARGLPPELLYLKL